MRLEKIPNCWRCVFFDCLQSRVTARESAYGYGRSASGKVEWQWDNSDPFGNNPPNENPSGMGTFENPLRLLGQYADKETGLFQNHYRDYDPANGGRYVESDPIGLMSGINTYTYVRGNPLSRVDPLGLYESSPWLRAFVPGQVAFDNFMTSLEAGNYGWASTNLAAALSEIALSVASLGTSQTTSAVTQCVARETTTVIGRVRDLQNLSSSEQSLLDRLPDLGSPRANWAQNSGVLREEMGQGLPIRDASPGDTGGQFLNAERNLLSDHGWTFNPQTNYWLPPPAP